MIFEAPIVCPARQVPPEWIDYNGHMNMAYYSAAFDQALDHVFDRLDIGADYAARGQGSAFTLEAHVTYLRELVENDPFVVHFRLLDWDGKRMHYFEEMLHGDTGERVATSEQICLHVSMETRRSAPFPERVQVLLAAMMAAHADLPRPDEVGHVIAIPRKTARLS